MLDLLINYSKELGQLDGSTENQRSEKCSASFLPSQETLNFYQQHRLLTDMYDVPSGRGSLSLTLGYGTLRHYFYLFK